MSLVNREPLFGIPANLNMARSLYHVELPSSPGKDAQGTPSPISQLQPSNAQQMPGPSKPPRNEFHWPGSFFSLRWRLTFVYIILFTLFVVFLSLFVYNSISSSLLHDGQLAFPQRVVQLRTQLVRDLCHSISLSDASNFIGQEEATDDIDNIYLLNSSGQVISSSKDSLLHQPFPYINQPFFSTWHPAAAQSFKGTTNTTSFDGLLLSVQPSRTCPAKNQFQGYLAATTSYSTENATLRNLLLMIILAALVMIIVGAIIIFYLTGIMLDPLRQMIGATQAMAQGDLQRRVSVPHSDDEIGALATSFNQMANRMEELFEVQQASEQRARRFVSDASHELRTPITSLRGFTEVLMRGAKDDPAITQRILKLMKYEADRMTRLVNDLLTLARLDEGHPLEMRNTDLVDIAIESVREVKSQAPESCKVSLDLATQERLKLQANAERLKQMLLILLDNAMKYGCGSENGSIILRLDKQDNNAIIQVIDRGQGISPEDLPHIFDRFYRGQHAPAPTGSPIGGTGLGLSIAIALAHAHHGTIVVTSELDKGTTLTVTLPCSP
jgi:two-component system OmpR family sensor kinase